MVLAFFKGGSGDGGFDQIAAKAIRMLGDARHSFDLATLAVLTDAGPGAVAQDVRETDQRINQAEQSLRSELIVHVSVHGTSDIGTVLGFTLLLKKIERIGDQAKNILDLADHGVSLSGGDDVDELLVERQAVSALFAEAAALLGDPAIDEQVVEDYTARAGAISDAFQSKIESYLVSDRPGFEVVPRAIYHRYLRRIVANLIGTVRTSVEPVPQIDYLADGTVDTDD